MSVKINAKLLGLPTWGQECPFFVDNKNGDRNQSPFSPCVSAMGLPEPTLEFYKYKQIHFLLQL